MSTSPSKDLALLLAFPEFAHELRDELRRMGARVHLENDRVFVAEGVVKRPIWAQVVGSSAAFHEIASIGAAARMLKGLGRRWACASPTLHRRSRLIQDQLHRDETRALEFGAPPTEPSPWGLWALLDEHRLVAAPFTDRPFPRGEVRFAESSEPPSRAYLKLWEVFSLHARPPLRSEVVADFGACPGGWSWVLSSFASKVIAIDKAPLAESVLRRKHVTVVQKDAFRLAPADLDPIDWFFSDIICEPPRLLELINRWREAGVRKFVATIKYKGATDFETTDRFLEIPGSRIVHLNANKHEVTWILGVESPF